MRDPDRPGSPERRAADIRPVVARQRGPAPVWLMAGGVVLGGILLFAVLDGQRRAATAPSAQARTIDRVNMPAALPPLYLPPEPPPPPVPPAPSGPAVLVVTPPTAPAAAVQVPRAPEPPAPLPNYPAPAFASAPSPALAPLPAQAGGNGAVLVVDTTAAPEGARGEGAAGSQDPVRTTRVRRRAMTVPQGTLIPAVLETALDSTRPGHARAVVSRDITGFDGSLILIPRGTRLFGDYQSDMAPGQNRALIQWRRLVRPDGVSIALASPSADMQGRAGVEGRVDSHFIERFGAALLQTTMNIGGALITGSIVDPPVVVASGGTAAAATATGSQGQSTLRVDAGARVGVLVARDLEFSSGEPRR